MNLEGLIKKAHMHMQAGEYDKADEYMSSAVELCSPGDVQLLVGIDNYYSKTGNALMRLKIVDKLLSAGVDPKALLTYKIAHLVHLSRYEEALVLGDFYIAHYGSNSEIYTALINANKAYGNASEIIYYVEKWLRANKDLSCEQQLPYYANAVMYANYDKALSPEKYKNIISRIRDLTREQELPREFNVRFDYFKKLKTGYLSDDLRYHPVGVFMYPIATYLPESEHDIFYYSLFNPKARQYRSIHDIDITAAFKKCGSWLNVHHLTSDRLERLLLREKHDVLFDLAAHTNGSRLWVFAKRIAPVQVSYLGFPTTTGVHAMDYNIVDVNTDPDGSEAFYTEKLIRMSKTSLCHVLNPKREPAPPPFVKNGHITFGCFANVAKHTSITHRLMAGVLNAVKDAKLLLTLGGYECADFATNIQKKLRQSGLPMDRVILEPSRTENGYLDCYDEVDIILDTFPFNGATTTCDALSMGVPVITLAGDTQASRRGLSILLNVGLKELITYTEEEYISAAAALAADHGRLIKYRSDLRRQKSESAIADATAFTSEFAFRIRKAWIDYCREHKSFETLYSGKTNAELDDEMLNAKHFIAYDQSDDVMNEYNKLKTEYELRGLKCKH